MIAIYRQTGEILDFTPTSDTPAGMVVVLGALVGITKFPISAGSVGTLCTRGVFENVPKHGTSNALTAGQVVYVNPSNGKIYNASASGYIPCGYALEPAPATATTCKIYLLPSVQPPATSS